MYRTSAGQRSADAVVARVLWGRRYVAPLCMIAVAAAFFFASALLRARGSLEILPYASPRSEPGQRAVLVLPARTIVGAYADPRSPTGSTRTTSFNADGAFRACLSTTTPKDVGNAGAIKT